ncbi:hypothetical protein [Gottfriedia acidiceleris]|uniref:hypothetical protein n=1 Tax=Gottfriedia acidiceleris TaxID=371036 RepID=UPI00101DEF0D|nr:hypothetical protein [Gottfriedia acidiceleris]
MKKKIICVICLALPIFATSVESASATQKYEGKLTGYLETKNSFNTSKGWLHVKHEQYSAAGKTIKITPLKKSIVGLYIPVYSASQTLRGNTSVTYQEGVGNGQYKLSFEVIKGEDKSYVGVKGQFW